MAEMLRLEGIHLHSDEGREIFRALDWNLEVGEQINIRCESGSGGPELLRLACGVLHPERGRVSLNGVPVDPEGLFHPFISRGAIGWVPGNGGLIVNQSLKNNLGLPLVFVKGQKASTVETRVLEGLQASGLAELQDQRPHALELRERWLAGLVRASLMEPELWLVEPPSGELDSHTRRQARRLLEQAVEAKATMIVLGEGGWIPSTLTHWKLENGTLEREEAP